MGCGSCGTGSDGKPSGCKSNGGCSSGGCNRLNVHDWLSTLPLHDGAKPYPIIEVSFNQGSRKEFFRNNTHFILEKNDWITVEGVGGYDVGQVSLTGELVKLQMKKYSVTENGVTKRVLHKATEDELVMCTTQKGREPEVLIRSRAIARGLNLDMKLCEVEVQADSKKGTFFYTADQRVDFRELIKLFANDFKMKVEMRQIGARQESGKVGGIGSCGRELCCSTWLSDFKSVNTTAARYQNLSINQTKLSGQCGRLKCCLNYELDTYMDALSVFPHHADSIETTKGVAHLQKRDIFKNLMWYSFSDHNKQYPLSIDRVKEIMKMNKLGQKPDDLQPVELEAKREKDGGIKVDAGFVNDVGLITLKNLEKNSKKKKSGGNKPQQGNRPQGDGTGNPQGPRPQQGGGNRPQGNRPQNNNRPKPQQQPGQEPQAGQEPRPAQEARPNQQPRPQQQPKPNQPQQKQGPRPPQQPRPPRQPNAAPPQEGGGEGAANPAAQQPNKNPNQQQRQGPKPQNNNRPRNQRPQGGQQGQPPKDAPPPPPAPPAQQA